MIRIITTFLILLLIGQNFVFQQNKVIDQEITINNKKIELPGTLSYHKNKKTPLIIWVHGSGNVDRNGNQDPIIKANYIKQFRDSITKKGISFFSFDKRTANKKNIPYFKNTLFTDLVEDVKLIIARFKEDTRFSKIILAGHSQGSLISMLAANNSYSIISIAGPSQNVEQVIIEQLNKQNPFLAIAAKTHFKELKTTGTIKEVNPALLSLFAKQNLNFLKSWMKFNPSEEIKKITKECLIINGESDLQVSIKEAKQLHQANKNAHLLLIKKMNHVLKIVNSPIENKQSYYSNKFPISEELINSVANFVLK